MNRKYVIIDSDFVPSVDFSQVLETSATYLNYNLAGTQTCVKFVGATPDFLEGKTQYTHSQILAILKTSAWRAEFPE